MAELHGKRVLVTGGSGEIGRAIVAQFLTRGAEVAAQCHSHPEALAPLAAEANGRLTILQADLTDHTSVAHLFRRLEDSWDGLDVLVNSVGGARPCPISELTPAEWERTLHLNLSAPFLCIQAAMPLLTTTHGAVINISSVAGFTGGAFGPHYATVKLGLVGLTRSAARDLGPLGIRVNAVAPGPVRSAMTESLPPQAMTAILATTALGRVVEPEEVSDAVLWLASAGSGVTGQTLVVDGGRHFH